MKQTKQTKQTVMEQVSSLFYIVADKYPDYVVGINAQGGIGAVKKNPDDLTQQWLLRPYGKNHWQLWNNQVSNTAATVSGSGAPWVRRWGISADVASYQIFKFVPAGVNSQGIVDKFSLHFNFPGDSTDYMVTVTDQAQHGSWYVDKTADSSWQTFTLEPIDTSQTQPDALSIVQKTIGAGIGTIEGSLDSGQFYTQAGILPGDYLQEYMDSHILPPTMGPVYVVAAAPVLSAQVNVLPGSSYTDQFDQLNNTPWFLAIREQFYSRAQHYGFTEENYGRGGKSHKVEFNIEYSVTDSSIHTSEETWGVTFGLSAEASFPIGTSGAAATAGLSLEIAHELKVTKVDEKSENTSKSVTKTFEIDFCTTVVGWTLVDRYRLYPIEKGTADGLAEVDVMSADPSSFIKLTGVRPDGT